MTSEPSGTFWKPTLCCAHFIGTLLNGNTWVQVLTSLIFKKYANKCVRLNGSLFTSKNLEKNEGKYVMTDKK